MISAASTTTLHYFVHLHFSQTVISANKIHVVSFEQTSCYLHNYSGLEIKTSDNVFLFFVFALNCYRKRSSIGGNSSMTVPIITKPKCQGSLSIGSCQL